MEITFLGAAGTVTGSKFLVTAGETRLLVDCGLFQGVKALRRRNWERVPVDVDALDDVILTHAHLDHSGYLPVLCREGFGGPLHCTEATADLCELLLKDAAHLEEEYARKANREGFTRHHPARPLFTAEDAGRALGQLSPVSLDRELRLPGVTCRFALAGHILGAATVEIRHESGTRVLFSGDLGRPSDLLMHPPTPPGRPSTIVMESTYGDRLHPDTDPVDALAEVVRRTVERGGVLLVPSFAVGRAQTVLLALRMLFDREPELRVPVFVDSPMARDATEIYVSHLALHRLTEPQTVAAFGMAEWVRSAEESRALCRRDGSAVVISASGMATGGRILHHLEARAPSPRNTVLFVGFQAPGTRGAKMTEGASTVKMFGRHVPVRAEVARLDLFSAHADQEELLDWVRSAEEPPRRVVLVHGEPAAADALRLELEEELSVEALAARDGETVNVE